MPKIHHSKALVMLTTLTVLAAATNSSDKTIAAESLSSLLHEPLKVCLWDHQICPWQL